MQTELADFIKDTDAGKEADTILRSCVHCGFCTATCPTYQILGDELDGPRGRIYLIKQMLEGHEATAKTQLHLDRCLSCRACETTCPSGVQYGRLVEIGRHYINQRVERPFIEKLKRKVLLSILPYPKRLAPLLKLGQTIKPLLPSALKNKIPTVEEKMHSPQRDAKPHQRHMLVLQGCAQSVMKPSTNTAAENILDKLGISLITATEAGCCGAVSYHMSEHDEGLDFMRGNINAWWPYVENGCEAILINASGCGAIVKEYAELLKHDPVYAEKAKRISALAKDPVEVLANEDLSALSINNPNIKVAFQTPCTLQHALQLNGRVEIILSKLGFKLTPVDDAHLCCGSAGTYSLLQSKLSEQLRDNKLNHLMAGQPDVIATANIGCHMHLQSQSTVPVKHWLELVADTLR
ncbi:MAG: glycolate oxidase subunit GlcF [Gammaproteobacteria bacterium]|nr:glycolate oxidase subunit GlcF [Gammaproteobacteria bacterium]